MAEPSSIATDRDIVEQLTAQLPKWVDEAGMMADMQSASERAGMRADPRTAGRANSLLGELADWKSRLSKAADSHDTGLVARKRILAKLVDCLHDETVAISGAISATAADSH
jgi:hypothetical protein